jgi:hypothetical protein
MRQDQFGQALEQPHPRRDTGHHHDRCQGEHRPVHHLQRLGHITGPQLAGDRQDQQPGGGRDTGTHPNQAGQDRAAQR